MTAELNPATLMPQTVIAVRATAELGWQMLALPCASDELSQCIADMGFADREKRFVGTGRVARHRSDQFFVEMAMRRGWHQSRDGEAWFPVDEPLPALPSLSSYAKVKLTLKSITFGCIQIAIDANGKRFYIGLNDLEDSPVLLIRFIQLLASGGQPHAAVADGGCSHIIVQDGPKPHLCRLYLRSRHAGEDHVIDLMTDRAALVSQFRRLAEDIADHPNFAHHFMCHYCLPDTEYDRVSDAADAEWERGIRDDRFADDFDAKAEFVAAELVAKVRLPDECAQEAAEYRTMLRSLEIPQDVLVRYGFAAMS